MHLRVVALHRLGEGGEIQRAATSRRKWRKSPAVQRSASMSAGLAKISPAAGCARSIGNEPAVLKVRFLEAVVHALTSRVSRVAAVRIGQIEPCR